MAAQDRYEHFDPEGYFWTPQWDFQNNQPMTVRAVRLPNGSMHRFRTMVSIAEANKVYQAAIRRGLGLTT